MTLFIGVKLVNATPMSRAEYVQYRGWQLPADEDPNTPGFLVEYLDGGPPNDSRHKGYISWSPADVFEKAYIPCNRSIVGLHDWQVRVVAEAAELEHRRDKLLQFLNGPTTHIPYRTVRKMSQQLLTMNMYLSILEDRIAEF